MKNVLITGGSRGIGREMVLRFSKEGYNTFFFYQRDVVSAEEVMRLCGATGIRCDVSIGEEVRRGFDIIHQKCKGIDILINNAGISEIKPFLDITDEQWKRMLSVTLDGAYYCSKLALSDMLEKKWGRVINISSIWGQIGASCEVHYSTAKAGLIGMTKALAMEFAPSGITVNCIAPGMIDTDMNREIDNDAINSFIEEIPVSRMGSAQEVADLAFYISSNSASYITGQVFGINGGYVM